MIHVPKTAGTEVSNSIKKIFGNYGNHDHLDMNNYKQRVDSGTWESIFKFSFIRCPRQRMVSTFKQLLSKRYKPGRNFDEYKTFNPENFNKWIINVWFPHVTGNNIKCSDIKMINWIKSNVLHDKPNGFNPNIYRFYLGDNVLSNHSLNLLDFRFCKKEFDAVMLKYQESVVLKKQNLNFKNASLNLNEFNEPKYDNFWTTKSRNIFDKFNFFDIKFYEAFINEKERGLR